jgi:hypothetical protein
VNRRSILATATLLAIAATLVGGLRVAGSATAPAFGSAPGVSPSGGSPAGGSKSRAARRGARSAAKPADTVLARVGGEKITRAEVQRRLDELPDAYRANYSTPDGRQQFIDRLLEERASAAWIAGPSCVASSSRPSGTS